MKKKSVRHVDIIGDFEALHAETLSEMRTLSLRLNFLSRVSILVAAAIADLHARESSRLLCELLKAESAARLKGPKGKDASLPGRRVKGRKKA